MVLVPGNQSPVRASRVPENGGNADCHPRYGSSRVGHSREKVARHILPTTFHYGATDIEQQYEGTHERIHRFLEALEEGELGRISVPTVVLRLLILLWFPF
jgi:hypothetical protein